MIVGRTPRIRRRRAGSIPRTRRSLRWAPLVFVATVLVGFFTVAPSVGACTHDIVIHKVETGVLAAGGTYDVRVTGPDFEQVVSVTAGSSTTIHGVAPGWYELEELGHPDALIEPNPVLVPGTTYDTEVDVSVTNHAPGARIAITKIETGTAAPGTDHVFDLTGPVTLTATVTAGTTWTSDWLPLGTYTITERNAPTGHTIVPNPVTLDTDEQTATVTATNPYPAGRLAIRKVLAGTTGTGAVHVVDVRGPVTFTVDVAAGTTWTSEPLPLGTYTVTERDAPAGHTIVPASATIESDGQIVTVVVTNPSVLSAATPSTPAQLPATGAPVGLGSLAAALVTAGGALVVAGRRRHA